MRTLHVAFYLISDHGWSNLAQSASIFMQHFSGAACIHSFAHSRLWLLVWVRALIYMVCERRFHSILRRCFQRRTAAPGSSLRPVFRCIVNENEPPVCSFNWTALRLRWIGREGNAEARRKGEIRSIHTRETYLARTNSSQRFEI
jgi:Protein of unknown function (DUF2826)